MKNKKWLLPFVLAGSMVFMAGCGDSKEASVSNDAVKSGLEQSANLEADAEGTDETADNKEQEQETGPVSSVTVGGLTITPVKMDQEYTESRLYLELENTTDSDLYIEWDMVLFSEEGQEHGGSVSDPGEETCCIKAHEVHQEVFAVGHDIAAREYTYYPSATVRADISNADKSQSEPVDVKLAIGPEDIEMVELSEPIVTSSVHFEEQELYNDGTVVFTVPEQTVEPHYFTTSSDNFNPHYTVVVHVENRSEDTGMWYQYAFLDAQVNGVAPQEAEMDWTDPLNGKYRQLIAMTDLESKIEIDNDLQVPFNTGESSGEITARLSLREKNTEKQISETAVTISYTVIE